MFDFLRLMIRNSYVLGLVIHTFGGKEFLPLGVKFLTFGGQEFLRLGVNFLTFWG